MSEVLYNVSFPKLDIFLKINPVAFKIGNIQGRWYGIIIALGFFLAFLYVSHRAKNFGLTKNDVADFTIIASVCGIIGARIYYVAFYPGDFYIQNPMKIFMISEGGIAIYGAIIGGFFGIWIMSKIKGNDVKSVLDLASFALAIGQSVGRWGNFVNQEAFGTETNLPWGMMSENTFFKTVHPCFLYESLGCFICFLFLHFYSSRVKSKPGTIFLLYTMLYGALRTLIEGLRTDSLMIPQTSLRVSQLMGILLFAVSAVILLIQNQNRKSFLKNPRV